MNLQLLFDALALGGINAIAALGIALIFGVMRLVNFAHGQFIACAVFALILPSADAAATMGLGRLPAPLLILAILCFGAGLAVLAEALVFRPLRRAEPVSLMVASFALGVLLQNLLMALYGARPKAVSLWPGLGRPVVLGGAEVPLLQLLVIGAVALILAGGLLYTVGVLFYLFDRLPFHYTVWHAFVLAASMVFFAAVTLQVVQTA